MNHDYAVMNDGTTRMVDDFEPGTLGVACQRGEVRKIVHIRQPRPFGKWEDRSKSAGVFRKSRTTAMTASQRACVEGT